MTTIRTSIVGSLVIASVIAGASGLVLSKVTAAQVEDLKDKTERLDEKSNSAAVAIGEIKAGVSTTKESVERIERKLDRLLDQDSKER